MKRAGDVIVLGSGIGGTLTALFAARAGFEVLLISKSSDPRKSLAADQFSSTFGGEDSRYVTITEGHPYLGTNSYVNEMYPDMQGAFTKSFAEGGWLASPAREFSKVSQLWLEKRFRANENQAAITSLFDSYIEENRQSMVLWEDLIKSLGSIETNIDLHSDGVLRLYGNTELFRVAEAFHAQAGVLVGAYSSADLCREFPAYAEACSNGRVVGALLVRGLTFRVQQLVKTVLSVLEEMGVRLRFEVEITSLEKNEGGEVTGLRSKEEFFSARHYSLHPGAYDSAAIYSNTPAADQIAGVAGGWISMPMPEGMGLPVKIHDGKHWVDGQERPVVDLNLNPVTDSDGKQWLLIGGGYLFVGAAPFEFPGDSFQAMLGEIHRVTELFLGPSYRNAQARGEVYTSSKFCVRSFTPDDAELDIVLPTSLHGVVTLEGGGNTGTTTKAPWIAQRAVGRFIAAERKCQSFSV